VPTEYEWLTAAQVLARYARHHGALKSSHHVADLLIALGAALVASEVVTDNLVDLRRWARARALRRVAVWLRATGCLTASNPAPTCMPRRTMRRATHALRRL
jgi:hypothetical protein